MRKSSEHARKGPSFAVLAACVGAMIAVVLKGMQLDKEEELKAKESKEKEIEKE